MNRAKLKQIVADFETALKSVSEKHNISIDFSGASFDDLSCKLKFECIQNTKNNESGQKVMFEKNALRFDIDKNWYNQYFEFKNKKYQIKKINTNSPKFRIEVLHADTNKSFNFTQSHISNLLK